MGLLEGKKGIIFGVATKKSIAWGIARALHSEGVQLAFCCTDNNVRRVKKLAKEVNSDIVIPCDVRKDEDIEAAFDRLKEAFQGQLHILVHSIAYANIDDLGGEFIKTTRNGWQQALDVSAYSLLGLARSARHLMRFAGGGSIIALTFGDNRVVPEYNIMGIAKAALDMVVKYLAYDLGPDNIRVNAINSGPIPTISSLAVGNFNSAMMAMEECSPMLRNVTAEDIGSAALYLASNLSSSVTGQVLKVDSGMSILCPAAIPHRRSRIK